jgi:hypothetical protein
MSMLKPKGPWTCPPSASSVSVTTGAGAPGMLIIPMAPAPTTAPTSSGVHIAPMGAS